VERTRAPKHRSSNIDREQGRRAGTLNAGPAQVDTRGGTSIAGHQRSGVGRACGHVYRNVPYYARGADVCSTAQIERGVVTCESIYTLQHFSISMLDECSLRDTHERI